MDFEDDDYEVYPFQIYRGFDLSDLTEREAVDVKDKIDVVYNDMTIMKEFCSKFLTTVE